MSEHAYPADMESMVEAQRSAQPTQIGVHPIHGRSMPGHFMAYLYMPESTGEIPTFDCAFIPDADIGLYEEHDSNRIQLMMIDQRKRMGLRPESWCFIPYVQRKADR
jgi:hypothetical protein